MPKVQMRLNRRAFLGTLAALAVAPTAAPKVVTPPTPLGPLTSEIIASQMLRQLKRSLKVAGLKTIEPGVSLTGGPRGS